MPSKVDVVVGNPPYVAFTQRTPTDKADVLAALREQYATGHVEFPDFTGKADLWAFFIAHAHQFLAPGGRLAFVLSWSLLCSDYGDRVMAFLSRYYRIDWLIDSQVELFFSAKQHVVMLCATKDVNGTDWGSGQTSFVRLKRPLAELLDLAAPSGARADDFWTALQTSKAEGRPDPRWSIQEARQ